MHFYTKRWRLTSSSLAPHVLNARLPKRCGASSGSISRVHSSSCCSTRSAKSTPSHAASFSAFLAGAAIGMGVARPTAASESRAMKRLSKACAELRCQCAKSASDEMRERGDAERVAASSAGESVCRAVSRGSAWGPRVARGLVEEATFAIVAERCESKGRRRRRGMEWRLAHPSSTRRLGQSLASFPQQAPRLPIFERPKSYSMCLNPRNSARSGSDDA